VNASEAKLTELESERFEFTESLGASVDVGLFAETVVSALGVKLHGDPVVSCVMRWLFSRVENWFTHSDFTSLPSSNRA